jgi:hypothetical protein
VPLLASRVNPVTKNHGGLLVKYQVVKLRLSRVINADDLAIKDCVAGIGQRRCNALSQA